MEPDDDDSAKMCPSCEKQNQFGETCNFCLQDQEWQDIGGEG